MILVIIDGIATSTSNGKAVFNIHIPLEPVSNEARHMVTEMEINNLN